MRVCGVFDDPYSPKALASYVFEGSLHETTWGRDGVRSRSLWLILLLKEILCRDLGTETSYRDLVQGSCQEVSYRDLAKRALIESLYRDIA